MRYFIIGFKSSGKTTFGKKLAAELKLQFIDLDQNIEASVGTNIPDLYIQQGEKKFRETEWKALKKLAKTVDDVVISTGGGAPCNCDNMNLMEKYGKVIYLKVSEDILVQRLLKVSSHRPIVMGKSETELRHYLSELRSNCEHHYLRATYIVEGDDPDVHGFARRIREDQ